jgi:hypothetical protein
MSVERRGQAIRIMINMVNWQQEEPTGCEGGRQPSMDGTSRVTGDCHARFCERLGVKLPGATRRRCLGGHLKTGQRNQARQGSYNPRPPPAAMENFSNLRHRQLYCSHLGGGYGSAGMRPERRPSGRNAGAASSRLRGILAIKR